MTPTRDDQIPLWGSAPIPTDRDHSVGDDRLGFMAVIKLFLRSWPWLRPQLIEPTRKRFVLGGKERTLFKPGHLFWFFVIQMVNQSITLITSAWTIDVLNQVLLQGQPMTRLQAHLLNLDIAKFVGVTELTDNQRIQVLWLYIVITFLLWCLSRPVDMFLRYYDIWIMQRVNQSLRMDLVDRWHHLSLRYHNDAHIGDSIYRMYQDSAMVVSVVDRVITVVSKLVSLATCVFLVSLFDPVLGGLCIIAFFPVTAWGKWFSPRVRVWSRASRENTASLTSRIQEAFSGIRVIKASGAEKYEQGRFEKDSVVAFNAAYRLRSMVAVITIVVFTVTAVLLLSAEFFMAMWASVHKPTAASELIGFFGVSFVIWNLGAYRWSGLQLFGASMDIQTLTRQWAGAQDIAIGLDRVFEILDIEPDIQDAPDAVDMAPPRRSIKFEQVSFAYAPGEPTIDTATFEATPGTINAIIGPTGSGKSTLMALLMRLFDPDAGRITIDDQDLRDFKVESLRDNIAIALQENVLFNMNVLDNIRFAHPRASDSDVKGAVVIACADEFIEQLPDGYMTKLGERANKLSTGQRQRVSIARALVKDAPILILDEPTAALDAETEQRVLNNLAAWARDRVVFLITHRLSTIRKADQILYLDNGRVEEHGTHDQLVTIPGGKYRAFVETEAMLDARRELT